MKKSFHFRQWRSLILTSKQSAQGFTMLEVLAALMISFAFLTGTLNAMLITALVQVKAERQSQAGYWIQQDLERVRSEAANLPASSATSPTYTASSACTGTFNATTSYGYLLLNTLGSNTTLTATADTLTASTITVDGITYNGKRQTQLVKTGADSTKTIFGQQYRLVRIAEGYDNRTQILKVTYAVGLPDDAQNTLDTTNGIYPKLKNDTPSSIIATLYTEVIPSPALSC